MVSSPLFFATTPALRTIRRDVAVHTHRTARQPPRAGASFRLDYDARDGSKRGELAARPRLQAANHRWRLHPAFLSRLPLR